MGHYFRIGEMLINKGKITADQLATALNAKASSRQRIGELLVGLGFVSEWDIAECLAEQYGFDVVDPETVTPDPTALKILDGAFAMSHRI